MTNKDLEEYNAALTALLIKMVKKSLRRWSILFKEYNTRWEGSATCENLSEASQNLECQKIAVAVTLDNFFYITGVQYDGKLPKSFIKAITE